MLELVSDTAGVRSGACAVWHDEHHQPKLRASSGDKQPGQFIVDSASGSPGNWMSTTSRYAGGQAPREVAHSLWATFVSIDFAGSSVLTADAQRKGAAHRLPVARGGTTARHISELPGDLEGARAAQSRNRPTAYLYET
jgi:hypothetical protein